MCHSSKSRNPCRRCDRRRACCWFWQRDCIGRCCKNRWCIRSHRPSTPFRLPGCWPGKLRWHYRCRSYHTDRKRGCRRTCPLLCWDECMSHCRCRHRLCRNSDHPCTTLRLDRGWLRRIHSGTCLDWCNPCWLNFRRPCHWPWPKGSSPRPAWRAPHNRNCSRYY